MNGTFATTAGRVPPAHLRPALDEARRRLEALYGSRLRRAVLYGSQARGDARPEEHPQGASDVDVLVALRGEIGGDLDVYAETTRLADLGLAMHADFGRYFSFKPFTEAAYLHRETPFMRRVRAEGLDLVSLDLGTRVVEVEEEGA